MATQNRTKYEIPTPVVEVLQQGEEYLVIL